LAGPLEQTTGSSTAPAEYQPKQNTRRMMKKKKKQEGKEEGK
jgi:hypothetical protein